MSRRYIALLALVLVLAAFAGAAAVYAFQDNAAPDNAPAQQDAGGGIIEHRDVLAGLFGGAYCTRVQFYDLLAQEGLAVPQEASEILSAPDFPVTRAQAAAALNYLIGERRFDPAQPGLLTHTELRAMLEQVTGNRNRL